jgi:hypothetical protein
VPQTISSPTTPAPDPQGSSRHDSNATQQ